MVKCLPAMWETWVQSLSQVDPLEKEMATHSSILAWRIPRTEEFGGLQSTYHKESDMTERLHFFTLNVIIIRVIYIFSWFGDNFKNTIFVVGGGQAKWLTGSYFPNQGLNPCPQQ